MHYLLFVPQVARKDLESASKVGGFATALDGNDVIEGQKGPRGMMGCMVFYPHPDHPWGHYDEAKQTWVPSIAKNENGDPRYWVGFWNEKPVQENQIRRNYTQAGNWVKLGEQRWKLPTPSTVEATAKYNDDGSMRWEVTRQFSWVCDEAEQLTRVYEEESGMRMFVYKTEPSAQINWLLKLLQINYRLLPEVAAHLNLWTGRDHILDTFLSTLGMKRTNSDG